jgi:hypothetical protein
MTSDTSKNPAPIGRMMTAFALAPLAGAAVAATAIAAWTGDALTGLFALVFAAAWAIPVTVFLGLPAYLILRRHLALPPGRSAFVGGIVAVVPYPIFMTLDPETFHGSDNLMMNALAAAGVVLLGGLGGFVFWAISTRCGVLNAP